jgi:hypothetical protein
MVKQGNWDIAVYVLTMCDIIGRILRAILREPKSSGSFGSKQIRAIPTPSYP